ncbi:unnamed protein product [Agarophyton chilense]
MRLVSCSMEFCMLYSSSTLHALVRIALIAVLHEIEERSATYVSRDYRRCVHYLIDVFQDKKIKSQELQEFRDTAVLILRRVSRLFRDSRKRTAMSIIRKQQRKNSWPSLVAVLRKEEKRLMAEYTRVSGNVPSDTNKVRSLKRSRNRRKHVHERDFIYQRGDDFDEDLLIENNSAGSESGDKYSVSLDYLDNEFEAPSTKFTSTRPQRVWPLKPRMRDSEWKSRAQIRKNSGMTHEFRSDSGKEAVGSVRHGSKRNMIHPKDDEDSVEYGGLESQDFPSAVVGSRPDDIEDQRDQECERDPIQQSSEELQDPGLVLGNSITLSDELGQAKLHGRETCVEDLHKASLALDALGPDDPLRMADESTRRRAWRKHGIKRSPREASPIPDSEGVQIMKRRKPNPRRLQKSPEIRHRDEGKNAYGQKLKRGRFLPHEDEWILQGIKKYGWGAWKEIVNEYYRDVDYTRNPVSVKDRARTLDIDPDKYPKHGLRGRPRYFQEGPEEANNEEDIDKDEDQ